MFEVRTHDTAKDFLYVSERFIQEHESENNLTYGIAANLLGASTYYGPDAARFWSVFKGSTWAGASLMTPPLRPILTRFRTLSESVDALARHTLDSEASTPGVVGPEREAEAFADHWASELSGLSIDMQWRLRVFEIRKVRDLPLAPAP